MLEHLSNSPNYSAGSLGFEVSFLPTEADNADISLFEAWEMNIGSTGETLESLNMIFPVFSYSVLGQICMMISYWDVERYACLMSRRKRRRRPSDPSLSSDS